MNKNSYFAALTALMLAGTVYAQDAVVVGPGQFFYAQQAPPAPPAPPAAPAAPFGEVMRLITSSGSYLGVGVRDVNEERKKALNLKEERGAEITSVENESPAAKAGLKTGDVVVEYNTQRVEGMEQFIRMVRETPSGREVKLTVVRAGTNTTVTVRPENMSSRMERSMRDLRAMAPQMRGWTVETMPRPAMNWQSTSLGIEAEGLNEQMAGFFGVKHGVLVRAVSSGSIAEKVGMKAGDVIVKVDETEVKTPREVTSGLRTARSKNRTVPVTVVRERKEQALKVTFPEDSEGEPAKALPKVRSVQNKELEL
jgi:serine protease Do